MSKIRLAIAGVGNCASAFIQGIYHYKDSKDKSGLLYEKVGNYRPEDIVPVAAFDVDERKVGKDLSEAIFAEPNCTIRFKDVPHLGVPVMMGTMLDGVPEHLKKFVKISGKSPVDVAAVLKETKADVLINILPTGSHDATRFYAEAALKKAKIAFINGIPEMIASSQEWSDIAKKNNVPLIGDDFKSQMGSTIMHRSLVNSLLDRGIKIDRMYQFNYAGNTDFYNLVRRGETKEKTKREALRSELPYEVIWGFSNQFINGQEDIKTGVIHIEGRNWGGNKVKLDMKIEVDDSANGAGVMIDMIRFAKVALDKKISGIIPACAYFAKHPPQQINDAVSKKMLDELAK
jgi:myo-inositol-1-phosphate synthase